jgi:uncharacterized membrane protein
MTLLVLGLVLFFAAHSVRIFADGWRTRVIAQRGEGVWKGAYTVLSLVGIVLISMGYGQARLDPVALWTPWAGGRHLAGLLTLVAFILLVATYVPGNAIKARVGHPMILGVKVWAAAHLLANHTLADALLFGGFLVWAVLDFRSARRRPAPALPPTTGAATAITVVVGLVAWAAFAFWGHAWLIGVAPFARAAA